MAFMTLKTKIHKTIFGENEHERTEFVFSVFTLNSRNKLKVFLQELIDTDN